MSGPTTPESDDGAAELAELIRTHAEGLGGAIRGVLGSNRDVQELLQDVYVRALRSDVWRRERGSLRDPVAWLFVIAIHAARDRVRRERRRFSEVNLEEVDPVKLGVKTDPLAQLRGAELKAAAKQAIARLTAAEKEVFLMRVAGGCSFAAIGSQLGIPVGTAKTRMRAALRRLRFSLAPFDPQRDVAEPRGDLS